MSERATNDDPKVILAPEIVMSCLSRLASWEVTFQQLLVFKVGICMSPKDRWENTDYGGYAAEKIWMAMDLIYHGPGESCRQLEIQLINSLKSIPGCCNIKPGGEGVQRGSTHPCFTYFVLSPCGEGVGLEKAYALRMQAKQMMMMMTRGAGR